MRSQTLDMYDDRLRTGVWKMLTIRAFDMDLMIIATIHGKHAESSSMTEQVKNTLLDTFGDCTDCSTRDTQRYFRTTSMYIAYQVLYNTMCNH